MRRALLVAAVACAALAAAAPASATGECRGLMVCVPVQGPWVLTRPGEEVQFQLACPRRYVVGGLDAELTHRSIDVGFIGGMGSPVNPGITTSTAAVFLGRFVGAPAVAASFRPHIGCVPSSGGGQRTPTAYHVLPPGRPTVRVVRELAVRAEATSRISLRCAPNGRLAASSHAIAFYVARPPDAELAAAVSVKRVEEGGTVRVTARGTGAIRGHRTVVQVDLVCAMGT